MKRTSGAHYSSPCCFTSVTHVSYERKFLNDLTQSILSLLYSSWINLRDTHSRVRHLRRRLPNLQKFLSWRSTDIDIFEWKLTKNISNTKIFYSFSEYHHVSMLTEIKSKITFCRSFRLIFHSIDRYDLWSICLLIDCCRWTEKEIPVISEVHWCINITSKLIWLTSSVIHFAPVGDLISDSSSWERRCVIRTSFYFLNDLGLFIFWL